MSRWTSQTDPERGTIEPPWAGPAWDGPAPFPLAARRGMLVLLLPLGSMFLLIVGSYFIRSQYPDWQPMALPWQLWLSTVLLLASSAAFEWTRRAAALAQAREIRLGLLGVAAGALAFLGSQLWAWQHAQELGFAFAANPANSFFYFMSGLHALHLIGGLVAWSRIQSLLAREADPEVLELNVALCAIYWHFLLVVWVILFGVLLLGS